LVSLYFVVFWLLLLVTRGVKEINGKELFLTASVIIPAYNEERAIAKTIGSVLNLDYPKEKLEIIIIDDGSCDKTADIVENFKKRDKRIKLIRQDNAGKGSALNNGLRSSNGEIFICLDADSCVKPNALKLMVQCFSDENVACVLPTMKTEEPRTFIQKIQWCEYLFNFLYKKVLGELDCVHVTPGPFSVYKKNVLVELGGFDEGNLTEDLEIALRLQKHHYKIVQRLDAEVVTATPDSLKGFFKQRNRWYKGTMFNVLKYKNMLFNKEYGDFGLLQFPRVAISGFLSVLALLLVSYDQLKPLFVKIQNAASINFDVSLAEHWAKTFSFLDINYINLFFSIVALALILYIVVLAYRYCNERLLGYKLSVPLFLIVYAILIALVWVYVFFEISLGRKQKW